MVSIIYTHLNINIEKLLTFAICCLCFRRDRLATVLRTESVGGQGETRHHWGGYYSSLGEREKNDWEGTVQVEKNSWIPTLFWRQNQLVLLTDWMWGVRDERSRRWPLRQKFWVIGKNHHRWKWWKPGWNRSEKEDEGFVFET